MIIPDVKCVLGETLAMQDAWRRGFEGALSQRVLDVGAEGISSADQRGAHRTTVQTAHYTSHLGTHNSTYPVTGC